MTQFSAKISKHIRETLAAGQTESNASKAEVPTWGKGAAPVDEAEKLRGATQQLVFTLGQYLTDPQSVGADFVLSLIEEAKDALSEFFYAGKPPSASREVIKTGDFRYPSHGYAYGKGQGHKALRTLTWEKIKSEDFPKADAVIAAWGDIYDELGRLSEDVVRTAGRPASEWAQVKTETVTERKEFWHTLFWLKLRSYTYPVTRQEDRNVGDLVAAAKETIQDAIRQLPGWARRLEIETRNIDQNGLSPAVTQKVNYTSDLSPLGPEG